jgi:hypothetical protein
LPHSLLGVYNWVQATHHSTADHGRWTLMLSGVCSQK